MNSIKPILFATALLATAPAFAMTPESLDALCKTSALKIVEDLLAMANPRVPLKIHSAEYFDSERSTSAIYLVRGVDGFAYPTYQVLVRAYDDQEITPQPFCQIRTIKDLVD